MQKVTVLKGGDSPEREISLISGTAIAKGLQEAGFEVQELDPAHYSSFAGLIAAMEKDPPAAVFLGLHGGSGENGQIQAALELVGFCHTGSGFAACALTMDKYVAKLMARQEGIPVADWMLFRGDLTEDYNDPSDLQGIQEKLGLPIMVKPNDGGSSVGISKVEELSQLKDAVKHALKFSNGALLERFIKGREFAVTVLDGKALPLVEIRPRDGWYDYQNKYNAGRTEYLVPAPVDEATTQLMQTYAERLWQVFGLQGYARVDFLYDEIQPWFLEVNTLPGMTPLSLTPMAARTVGIDFPKLMKTIVDLALR